jgi:aldose 1-epimerase
MCEKFNRKMNFSEEEYGVIDGQKVKKYIVSDSESGYTVEISDYGATLIRVKTPDRDGNVEDINFGQDSPELYKKHGAYLGAMVGRVANRIRGGQFSLEGVEYQVVKNLDGKHHLHGGDIGFNYKIWNCIKTETFDNGVSLVFEYISNDGEENYPGTLTTQVEYRITPMKLSWTFTATTDKTTILNLTNHAYWNLNGLDSLIDDLEIKLSSKEAMVGDEDNMITGEIKSVSEMKLNLTDYKNFSTLFNDFGDVDNSFFVDGYKEKKTSKSVVFAANVRSLTTGRTMKVETSEPIIHLYTGNYMEGVISFEKTCRKHSALCLETQRVPDAINIPEFRESVILKPGEKYFHKTVHYFGTC